MNDLTQWQWIDGLLEISWLSCLIVKTVGYTMVPGPDSNTFRNYI